MRAVHAIAAAVLFMMMPATAFPAKRDDQVRRSRLFGQPPGKNMKYALAALEK
jgi:hypothetical protein